MARIVFNRMGAGQTPCHNNSVLWHTLWHKRFYYGTASILIDTLSASLYSSSRGQVIILAIIFHPWSLLVVGKPGDSFICVGVVGSFYLLVMLMNQRLREIILNDPRGGLVEDRVARVAEALGVTSRTVYRWTGGQPIPEPVKKLIEALYGDGPRD